MVQVLYLAWNLMQKVGGYSARWGVTLFPRGLKPVKTALNPNFRKNRSPFGGGTSRAKMGDHIFFPGEKMEFIKALKKYSK